MKFLSVCSGIEAASVACEHLNWRALGFSEIEDFPNAVLKYHYPKVNNYGDINNISGETFYGRTDLLIGGTPCQGMSQAGKRKGLDDERSGLAWQFIRLLDEIRPRWFVWENVPGAMSTNGGRDYATIVSEMEKLGYGVAGRILDAKNFGVPQNRRRIFLVGYLGDWRPSFGALFEPESLSRNIEQGKKQKQRASPDVREVSNATNLTQPINNLVCFQENAVRPKGGCNGKGWRDDDVSYTLMATAPSIISYTENRYVYDIQHREDVVRVYDGVAPTLTARCGTGGNNVPLVLDRTDKRVVFESHSMDNKYRQVATSPTVRARWAATDNLPIVLDEDNNENSVVLRRLTPLECERLQGFPDNYTNVPYRGKPSSPKTRRYEALGNSIAVPVLKWIFNRIQLMEDLLKERVDL